MPATRSSTRGELPSRALMRYRRLLAVVAHPDDESFGLGALLSAFVQRDNFAGVLCFTHGEASTLGDGDNDLHAIRARELRDAANELGIAWVRLLDHPDGQLAAVPLDTLREEVTAAIDDVRADVVLVFGNGGVTGHPDHVRATEAAVAAAHKTGLPVVAWTLSEDVARSLNSEFGTMFEGRCATDILEAVTVDREAQLRAIAQHRTQTKHNPVLWRRLELEGDQEWIRIMEAPS